MFTVSVADSLMPRSSNQRPDCGASIRTTHLSPPIRSAIAVTGAMPLSGLASVTDTPWAVVSGCSSPSSSWIAISTGPARPGDTLMLAIASLREEGFVGIVGGYHGCGLARSLDPGQRVRRATADALDRKRHVHLTGALERQRYRTCSPSASGAARPINMRCRPPGSNFTILPASMNRPPSIGMVIMPLSSAIS